MKNSKQPLSPYQKDEKLEKRMIELNTMLLTLQEEISKGMKAPKKPAIFLLGLPRSGHTLLAQLLITRFHLAYPTNFVARLWKVPGLAARIQRLALESAMFNYPSDLMKFESDQGLTWGVYGIHEFGYFWREIFNFGETHSLTDEEWERVDKERLLRLVASLEYEFGDLPVLFKSGQLIFQATRLSKLFPKSVFICCLRDSLHVAQSLAVSREKRFGNREEWFSFRPPEYVWLKSLPWREQISGQIAYIKYHLKKQMEQIPSDRVLWLHYEEICDNPRRTMKLVEKLLSRYNELLKIKNELPEKFAKRNITKLSQPEVELLKKSLRKSEANIEHPNSSKNKKILENSGE